MKLRTLVLLTAASLLAQNAPAVRKAPKVKLHKAKKVPKHKRTD